MRKGQVALYVLLGTVLLLLLLAALYLVGLKRSEMAVSSGQAPSPDILAAKTQMQERIDRCLKTVAGRELLEARQQGLPSTSIADDEAFLAQEIVGSFPGCYYQPGTDQLAITDDQPPRVTVTLGPAQMLVDVRYASSGEYEGKEYVLDEHAAQVPTDIRAGLERAIDLRRSLQGEELLYSQRGTPLVDQHCNVDLYAYESDGWYADLVKNDDGSMTVFLYDYNEFENEGDYPPPLKVDLPPCGGAA